ncbi:MAG: sulfotransferase family 2 domain-containing protein [Verrucomicrobia bacterium]|nr:sulfotransferase family 2 domain-containing protein [Verrucomicrobiota bacterium]
MADERTIILHYHLFKNAGTSVDAILKKNFGDRWVTREFPARGGNNTPLVEDWIRETPEAVAYSSHTMMGPIPQVEGVRVISFMLLRDPIERIRSAYRFERTQEADTWGARLAKEHDFEGYVRARLARPGDRQCRNFQTYRLASLVSGEGSELERAKRALKELTVVGRVEAFDEAMATLQERLDSNDNTFSSQSIRANQSEKTIISHSFSDDFAEQVALENQLDTLLLDAIRNQSRHIGAKL